MLFKLNNLTVMKHVEQLFGWICIVFKYVLLMKELINTTKLKNFMKLNAKWHPRVSWSFTLNGFERENIDQTKKVIYVENDLWIMF